MRALALAATGMAAQQTNVEVIANNLANINTTGFKRGKAEFSDLMYEAERLQGVSNRGTGNTIPEGAQLGLGVRMAAIRNLQTQGSFTNTGNTFDLGIQGRGWFQLTGPNGDTVYTRAGAFNTNATGQLVSLDGYAVSPAIIVPNNSTNVTVSSTRIVTAPVNGAPPPRPPAPPPRRRRSSGSSRSRISPTRPASSTSAPTCSAKPRPRARPWWACRATPASAPSARATSKPPTSTP